MSDLGTTKCLELMTTGKWVTGRSAVELASEFDVTPKTVGEWAACASRIIRLAIEADGAKEDIRARLVATLDRIVERNVDSDGKTAVSAIGEQGKLLGLVTQTHKVDMSVRQYEELPPAALRAKLLEQRARIDEALAKLDAELPEQRVQDAARRAFKLGSTPDSLPLHGRRCLAATPEGTCIGREGHDGNHVIWNALRAAGPIHDPDLAGDPGPSAPIERITIRNERPVGSWNPPPPPTDANETRFIGLIDLEPSSGGPPKGMGEP